MFGGVRYPGCARVHYIMSMLVEVVIASLDVGHEVLLEDELALLVLFRRDVGAVVLPAQDGMALIAPYIADGVHARGHVPVLWLAKVDIDDLVKEECLAVLAVELARDERVYRGEVGVALHAAEDAVGAEELGVGHAHGE